MERENKIEKYKDLGWILNPDSTFALTILGTEKGIAIEIKRILDKEYSEQVLQELTHVLMHHKIRCKEIGDYVNMFKPIFQKRVNELIGNSEDWKNSDEDEREDLLSEFEQSAIESLDIQPSWGCELALLFAWPDVLAISYYREIAFLLSHTYTMAKYATEEKKQSLGPDFRDLIKTIEILTTGDPSVCSYCKKLSREKYSTTQYPNIPWHLGCRCTVIANI